MYTNNAYLNNSTVDRKDKSKPLVITMCVHTNYIPNQNFLHGVRVADWISNYFLSHLEKPTSIFNNDSDETIVHAGHMVLYRPKEPQKI